MSACPRCSRELVDHTVAELGTCSPAAELNLPFERVPGEPQRIDTLPPDAVFAVGTVVAALRLDTAIGPLPGLRLMFTREGVNFAPPVIQIFDGPDQARAFAKLVTDAVEAAIEAATS